MNLNQPFRALLQAAPKLQDPTEIRTEINKPNPERPGYVVLDRAVTLKEFEAQVRHTLSTIMDVENDANAEELAEWISPFESADNALPDMSEPGDLVAFYRMGSCEGEIVDIAFVPRADSGTAHKLIAIKYLHDRAFVQRVANTLTDALYEGGFN